MHAAWKAVQLFGAVTVISYACIISCSGCSDKEKECLPCPACPSASSSAVVVPSASSSVKAPRPKPPPKDEVAPLEELPTFACYKRGPHWAVISSREHNQKGWSIPYPYQLKVENELDCGIFPTMQPSGWRTAYCLLEDGTRKANKLYIYTYKGTVGFRIGLNNDPGYKETKCPSGT